MSEKPQTPAPPPLPPEHSKDGLGSSLELDHGRLDELWDRATEVWPSDRTGAVALFKEFHSGLLRHIQVEEENLFPFYETRNPTPARHLTDLLREEHSEIRGSLERLMALVHAQEGSLEGSMTVLRNVLWTHNTREEGMLYPWFDEADDESALRLGREVRGRLSPAHDEVSYHP